MPLAIDPNEIYPYIISTDRSKPVEKRPTLLFYFPTCKETRQIASLFDQSEKAVTLEETIKLRCDAIRLILASWKNFVNRKGEPVPFEASKLEEILSDIDITELKERLLRDMSMSELEKKRLVLFPPSNSASSVPDATASA